VRDGEGEILKIGAYNFLDFIYPDFIAFHCVKKKIEVDGQQLPIRLMIGRKQFIY